MRAFFVTRRTSLAHVGAGRGAERHGVLDVLVQEVELELGADGVVEKDLVAGVLDVLLLELDVELLQALAEIHGARGLEGDVVHAAAVLVLDERALGEARADVNDGILAVVEPDAAELEVGAVAGPQPQHVAVELLDRGQIFLGAADVEMQETLEFHGVPPGKKPDCCLKSYHRHPPARTRSTGLCLTSSNPLPAAAPSAAAAARRSSAASCGSASACPTPSRKGR